MSGRREYGIHRGTVTNNVDPKRQGRVQVQVPAVTGEGLFNWAQPCTPCSGDGLGLFMVPSVGAEVWVAFEAGDIDRPVVVGGFWTQGTPPSATGLPGTAVLKTDAITITLDSTPGAGGLTIEIGSPAVANPVTIAASSSGVELSVGASKVQLNGVSVKINDGALEVL